MIRAAQLLKQVQSMPPALTQLDAKSKPCRFNAPTPTPTATAWRLAGLAVLLAAAALSGCAPAAIVANVFTAGSAIKAKYTLPEGKRVLVLVDDPNRVLMRPRLRDVIAAQVDFQLKQQIDGIKLVPISDVAALEAKLGDRFKSASLVSIGRVLDAPIVIYVAMDEAKLNESYGVYQPEAHASVTVINSTQQTRLFPHPGALHDEPMKVAGYPVAVSLGHWSVDQTEPGTSDVAMRALANRIGLRVAELFYDHAADTGKDLDKH